MSEQIKATIIAHSKSAVSGKEIVTFELQYPRFIHSELMTHRMFSRNAMSSRAVPIEKMFDQIVDNYAEPIHWGKNQPGMQAKEELTGNQLHNAKIHWEWAASKAVEYARYLAEDGAHKQVVNRILEPFQLMKTVLTATEFENFFWLRNHEDAQPEIKRLAVVMQEALEKSEAKTLPPGWWHVPYFHNGYWCPFMLDEDCYNDPHTLKEALAISSSCCAQVSYRKLDDSLEKAQVVYKRLVESEPVHASPFEHQATPIELEPEDSSARFKYYQQALQNIYKTGSMWQEGITHTDREGNLWSGNFKDWIQHRQLIPNNVKKG